MAVTDMSISSSGSRRENVVAVRALYNQCESYDDLLSVASRTRDLLAAQLANRIRNWRANHDLDSLDEAFTQHKAFTFTDDTHKHRSKRARTHTAPSSSPLTAVAPDVPAQTTDVAPAPPLPAAVSSTLAELQAQIDALKKEVSALRGLQQQTNTPLLLQYKLIVPKFRKHCRVLSIVGDGRCLMYSLLQVGRAMLPTSWEADDLRQLLRTHLITMYTDQTWRDRVPAQLGENLSVSTFADRSDVLEELGPGIVVVADLTDPLLASDEANGIFQVLVEQFRAASFPGGCGKLLALDEAHKFMDGSHSDGLSSVIVNAARLMRHDGLRLVVSTQSPKALAPELLELVSVAVLHRFHSQDWFTY